MRCRSSQTVNLAKDATLQKVHKRNAEGCSDLAQSHWQVWEGLTAAEAQGTGRAGVGLGLPL